MDGRLQRRDANFLRFVVVALLFITACSSSDADLCDRLDGDWRSVEKGAAVETGDGETEPAFEELSIFENTIDYHYSDVVQSGEFRCSNNRITAFNGGFEAEVGEDGSSLVIDKDGFIFEQL